MKAPMSSPPEEARMDTNRAGFLPHLQTIWKGELAKKRPVCDPSKEKTSHKESKNVEKLDVAGLWRSAVLRKEYET